MGEKTRRVALLRHSTANWSHDVDHERQLSERGREQAPAAGRWLARSGLDFDLVLSSTAVRCRETWGLAERELSAPSRTVFDERLYEAAPGDLVALLHETDDDVDDLLIVGHNPGLHWLADALTGEADGDLLTRLNLSGFPASSVALLTFEGPWHDVEHGVGRLVAYWTPSG
ncbi:SixA phosphatase family protein [Nocardiopsis lucentensis]|uniref:SixA phosphatase family protein n=1 Tax=Nocardiopsis lucentensis TaxID=53441 RepID=UPI00034BFBB2|nr:histidine phosphatase family protein [Nocardiopsis lucentensis]